MLPDDLLYEIDRIAGARGRSRFLAAAAKERLARLRFDQATSRGFGAWKAENHPNLVTDSDMSRYLTRIRSSTTRRVRRRARRG